MNSLTLSLTLTARGSTSATENDNIVCDRCSDHQITTFMIGAGRPVSIFINKYIFSSFDPRGRGLAGGPMRHRK